MSDSKRSLSASLAQPEQVHARNETGNDEAARAHPVAQKKNMQDYEVVFVVDEKTGATNQKAFDFALETAKNFAAKLVLLYSVSRESVPESYLEYARVEGIRDYGWQYYEVVASLKLESLCTKAEEAGVEWTAEICIGDAKKSNMNSFFGELRTIIVLNKPARISLFRRPFARLLSKDIVQLGVPVIVF